MSSCWDKRFQRTRVSQKATVYPRRLTLLTEKDIIESEIDSGKGVEFMLTIAVCDDNLMFAKMLATKLAHLCAVHLPDRIDVQFAPIFTSASDVLRFMDTQTINILFLDIDMPVMNGFKLAETLGKKYPDTIIIFVSAYEEFVYSSFEYCPFRFLRKTHLDQELPVTFQKVIEKYFTDYEIAIVNSTDGEQILRIKDILYIEGQKNYFGIHTTSNKSYKCRGTMDFAEDLVQNFDFFRIHAAYIVNEEHIDSVDNGGYIKMKNGKIIDISKRRFSAFKDSYMQFLRRRFSK
jgi:DNA-binding LytR/AlgR family response regulator